MLTFIDKQNILLLSESKEICFIERKEEIIAI